MGVNSNILTEHLKNKKRLQISGTDVITIINKLSEWVNEGEFELDIDIENPDFIITARGEIISDGYYDNDYYNGTGEYIETYRNAFVELTVYDENCEKYFLPEVEREVNKYLNLRR